ncbi:hypothetical protein L596_020522 [Steinernema carpocapsae]|uniref:7TM GPCR serpentine receptor class x (Srx) domain-containing protein n=1 Tax=Steinernema carpocapsae TaxID=34508 RepID=A0A4U5MUG1_STECR|nr:hypothetical protein L596_020522 [Steinernema carpocapsae]
MSTTSILWVLMATTTLSAASNAPMAVRQSNYIRVSFNLSESDIVIHTTTTKVDLAIFISKKKYRDLQCYRIMIHMGLVQIVYSFGAFWFAILQLCDCDPLTLGTQGIRLTSSTIKAEGIFELLLALNRLCTICQLKCPDVVFVILTVFSWVFLIANQVVFSSSLAGYSAVRGYYVIKLDLSLPYTLQIYSILGLAYELTLLCALVIYIAIVLHLIYVKWRSKNLKDMSKEAKILIYAVARNIREEFFCRQPKPNISTITVRRSQSVAK